MNDQLDRKVRSALKPVDAWWVVVAVDPVAVRLLPLLYRVEWITPTRLTVLGGLLRVASVVLFAGGWLIAGAVAYELSFLLDALDGKLARMRGSTSASGAFLDLTLDIVLNTAAFTAIALWSAAQGFLPVWVPPVLSGAYGVQAWLLEYRSRYAGEAPRPVGDRPMPDARGLRGFLARHRLAAVPWSIDVEHLALVFAPLAVGLLGYPAILTWSLALATAYYLVVIAGQWARTMRRLSRG